MTLNASISIWVKIRTYNLSYETKIIIYIEIMKSNSQQSKVKG